MKAKYKANELVEKFSTKSTVYFTEDSIPRIVNAEKVKTSAVRDAIIAVDEILRFVDNQVFYDFFKEVKQHLEEML